MRVTRVDLLTGRTRTKDKYRVVYSDHQRLELEKEFHYSRYITIRRKSELAQGLGLSERQVWPFLDVATVAAVVVVVAIGITISAIVFFTLIIERDVPFCIICTLEYH